ncbi:MAG: PQ loop repeat protein [Chloroflexi bacterium OLB14]|nr:MAG: PQ loop repeat protein [Chloroflexi bacterium OLB14]
MTLTSILGTFGTILGLFRAMPQLVRLVRAKEAFGVSVDTAATSAICSFSWVIYGVLTEQFFFSLSSGLTGFIFTLITLFALRFGRQVKEFKVTPIWFIVLLLAGVIFGENGLGLVLSISVLISNVPQIWLAYKENNLADLSLGTWLISTIEGTIWLTYAFLQQDIAIIVSAFFQATTSAMIVALKLIRGAKNQSQEG